jgi:hypothetical protein
VSILGALLFVIINCVRPQEFIPAVQSLGVLNIATIIALIGLGVDVGTGKLRSFRTPQLPFLFAFLAWCALCTVVKVGTAPVVAVAPRLGFSALMMLVLAYSGASFERFRALALVLVAIAVLLASFGVREATSPLECIVLTLDEDGLVGDMSDGTPSGIDCEGITECVTKTKDYQSQFVCEKTGLFGTFSVDHGRVRWRGTLADPNELALFISAALSFAFAAHASAKGGTRHLLLAGAFAISVACVVMTGSRSGQLVLLTVLMTYFVRRYGLKGVVIAAMAAAPVIALGGRETEGAESSALERIGALYDGFDFFRASPLFGLGCGQFVQNYFITAHNSYLLSAAELGFPGMVLWSCLLYVSVKIPYTVGARPPVGMDPRLVPYGFALMTSFAGLLVGIFFLSFCYDTFLFMYLGLAGALFLTVKRTVPDFDVKVSGVEIGAVVGIDALLLAAIFVYTRIKGAP